MLDGDDAGPKKKVATPEEAVTMTVPALDRNRRGFARQAARRQAEHRHRRRLLNLCRRMKASAGISQRTAAKLVELSPACLSTWSGLDRAGDLRPRPLGRPPRIEPAGNRNTVLRLIDFVGPCIGVAALQYVFPLTARDELRHLLSIYRRIYRVHHQRVSTRLVWTRPGAVWAMDFAEPPTPVDGVFRSVFAVRDLASGQNLLWLPVDGATGHQVNSALEALFMAHGAPLVIKEDNAGAFRVPQVRALMERHGVVYLRSPVRMPCYNGGCESGIGTLKTYTHYQAARHGRAGQWMSEDVETARTIANALGGPNGARGPRAVELWQQRARITLAERERFTRCVERQREQLLAQRDGDLDVNDNEQVKLERRAVSRALADGGFLLFQRKRISPPIKTQCCSRLK